MAIKFNFTLNDAEAENLFSWLHSQRTELLSKRFDELTKGANKSQPHIDWYDGHIKYMDNVQKRMLESQERLPDSKDFEV